MLTENQIHQAVDQLNDQQLIAVQNINRMMLHFMTSAHPDIPSVGPIAVVMQIPGGMVLLPNTDDEEQALSIARDLKLCLEAIPKIERFKQ